MAGARANHVRRPPNDYIGKITVTKTFNELVAEINDYGWELNNLFQWGTPAVWRANVQFRPNRPSHNGACFGEFCDADTPEEALTGAILSMKQARNDATQKKSYDVSDL